VVHAANGNAASTTCSVPTVGEEQHIPQYRKQKNRTRRLLSGWWGRQALSTIRLHQAQPA
jgi:hypothetical protein